MLTLVATGCMPAAHCAGELQLTCDGPEDCGGAACCLPPGSHVQTTCSTTAACSVGLPMCRVAADCQPGELCCPGVAHGYPTGLCQAGPCPE